MVQTVPVGQHDGHLVAGQTRGVRVLHGAPPAPRGHPLQVPQHVLQPQLLQPLQVDVQAAHWGRDWW